MRWLGLGQEQYQDWRGNVNEREQEVTNEGQWLIRNVGVIGRSRECQDEEGKGEKAILLQKGVLGVSAPS